MKTLEWPDPSTITIDSKQHYHTPDGRFPRVTKILKVLGLGTESLIRWSASVEREAVLAAVAEVLRGPTTDDKFIAAVEARLGSARAHQKQLTKAGEIGTAIHQAIHTYLRTEMGLATGAFAPDLPDEGKIAFLSFQAWWKGSGLKPVRMEQPVWDAELGYAGTIDFLAEDSKEGLGLVDFKSSKGIYDDHHLQVAAYVHAARNFGDVRWAKIVRFPKSLKDPEFEVKNLGELYSRVKTQDQLMVAFRGALDAYKELIA